MPTKVEYNYTFDPKTGRTTFVGRVDNRTLTEAKAERMSDIKIEYEQYLKKGSSHRLWNSGRAGERGLTDHEIRNAYLGRGNAQQNLRITNFDSALYTRKANLESAVAAALTNAEVDAVHVTFDDITFSG